MILTASALLPMVTDLVRDELSRLRNGSHLDIDSSGWTPATAIGGPEIDVDSIELLSLVTACAGRFGLQELDAGDYLLRKRTLGDWAELAATGVHRTGALTFHTSGTSGPPRPHRHRLEDLQQEVEALAELFPETRRIISLVPSHHIYGCLTTILLPLRLGCAVVHIGDGGGHLPPDIGAEDLLVGFPLRWRQLLATQRTFPPGVEVITSTAPCPAETIAALERQGVQRVVSLYGSTETAGIGFRSGTDTAYQLFDHWEWDGQQLWRTPPGTDTPVACSPPDNLLFSDDRHFQPTGRRDGIVQVAGVNVQPESVAERLREHPSVVDCSVRLDHSDEPRLAAFIILSPGETPATAEAELRSWIRSQLSTPERPVNLTFGAELPRSALGKPIAWGETV